MTAILFLLAAVVMAAIGIVAILLVNRKPPKSSLSSIDEFARRKQALAPRRPADRSGHDAPRRRGA